MARFTDELRALAGTKWNAVVEHRFTDELAAGTVADGVLARYLIQDHRFLDALNERCVRSSICSLAKS